MLTSIRQKLILASCALFPGFTAGAATLSVEDAKDVAADFFQSSELYRLADRDAFTLVYTATDDALNPVCYVFNAKDGQGFVIVSAEDNTIPVIGYSYSSVWHTDALPEAATGLLSTPVAAVYDGSSMARAPRMGAASSQKLLTTPTWSQEAPFNNNIPNRRLTGCVGVALAEIMKYHSFPASRPASLVNAGQSSDYAWSTMRNDNYRSGYTNEEADAVATLVADAAIAIGTDFGMSSSSAFEVKVPYALSSMFGYDAGVSYKKRSELDRATWDDIIVAEIDADRPVLYCGQDVSAGHAFVCDGYEMRGDTPYLHINWGWGGSADGYYASDALNPVVSKAHHYNDLMTIVYNIKPATNALEWSPIHVTSDEQQVGLTLDVEDITRGAFTVRVGALKNISNTDFNGKLSVALFDAAGNQKALLNDGSNFTLWALQIRKYIDFNCTLPSGVSVGDSDVVRLVTQASGDSKWLPVAGDLLAPGEMLAKNASIPYFNITLPASSSDAEVSANELRVIKGRDYSFKVVPQSVDKVITVKANGFILTPDASNNYKLVNVLADQTVILVIQNAADVLEKSTLWVEAGKLQTMLDENETSSIKDLTLFGTMNAEDFAFIRERMRINRLDISQVNIVASGANPANALPKNAFRDYRCLQTIILPSNLNTFKNACLGNTGLTSIEIPASVATWEYNVFAGCNQLREVTVRRSSPAWVNWCVFTGTPQTKLTVPVGATAAYKAKEYWQDFKEIVEEDPVPATTFSLTVAEKKGLKFTAITEGTKFNKGENYEFRLETDDSFEDATMMVYANSTRLTADANGVYRATINSNTLIHAEFKQPQSTTVDQTWKLTGDLGGIGLVTDVVNVPFNKVFTVRANAIKIPQGDDAAKFYGMVLTDKNGNIKEFISSIISNYYSRNGETTTYNFYCQVKEAQVKEGNQLRLATSYNKKDWQLVGGADNTITDRLEAINNPVIYHNVTMPESVTGARIDGGASQVVRGMPFNVKVTAINPAQRVTVSINGETKATNVPVANVSVPAVLEDLDVTITVKDADAGDYMVFNIQEGQLASKLADCPDRVKLMGNMLVSDFDALRAHASVIIDLDMSDVTIKGAMMTGNSIPENAFAPTTPGSLSALRTIILPNNLERIDKNAFARCTQISELTIPANVTYIGDGAFASCVGLKKIIAKPKVAPVCGNMSPFPQNAFKISLEVPKGSEESYSVPSTWWSKLDLYQTPAEHKDYYWVKINDRSRVGVYDYNGDLNNVAVGSADVEFILELPNCQQPKTRKDFRTFLRPGVAFKLYDNGADVFANPTPYQYEVSNIRVYPYQHWSMTAGRHGIRFLHSSTSGPWMPQNHEIDIWFYYSINFENKEGANGIQAQIIEMPEGCEWRNVPMVYFQYNVGNSPYPNSEVKPVLYKEGSEIKFKLTDIPSKTEPVVNLMTKVMTKAGETPEYEEREMVLEPQSGVYTIPALQGDTWIRISGVTHYDEGDAIPADALSSFDKEDVVSFTELTVTGEMGEEEFEMIRDNFDSVESLDLSGIENESIPEGAFAGMENLQEVTLPETVTEIGAGAFEGCTNIATLTLPSVAAIGEGAFEGCTSLTSLIIPSAGKAPANAPARVRARVAAGTAITAESFKGMNPNCLIYLGSIDIPNAEDLNIILSIGQNRVAASDIILDGNYAFSAPAGFNLGDHQISFTVDISGSLGSDDISGWKGLMLPFTPSKWSIDPKIDEEIEKREGSGLHVYSFADEESDNLTQQTKFVANHPYLANVAAPYRSVPVTFIAYSAQNDTIYDVPSTPLPEETVAKGKNFSLYGSFNGETTLGVCYTLNETASSFVRPATDEKVAVCSFDAYLRANDGIDIAEFAIGEHPIWVFDPVATGIRGNKLYSGSKIEMGSDTKGADIYYTLDESDPSDATNPERKKYEGPFDREGDEMNVRAFAEYNGKENVYKSDVVTINYKLQKVDLGYDLAQNWNWISHNMESPVAVSDFVGGDKNTVVNHILSQTQEVIRDPKYGLIGSLKKLAPAVAYKLCADEATSARVAGIAYNPTDTVQLHAGWNWIGCPVDDASLLVADLLAALEAEEGDMLVGLEG
ncbi:MAG: C10 family peptidase, partial [Muribaculaceae bacterium]|nr:C10 family peptidase [Muribaculaceae bacterium]